MRGDLLKRKVVIIGQNNGNCDDFIHVCCGKMMNFVSEKELKIKFVIFQSV
jgi:hypothetical protein